MAKLDEIEGYAWVQTYYNEPKLKLAAIEWFLAALGDIVAAQALSVRARVSLEERRAEAILCLLVGFDQAIKRGNLRGFQDAFRKAIRQALKKYSPSRGQTTGLNEASERVPDPRPNPHENAERAQEYAMAKGFLEKHYKASLVTQFMEKFAEGKTYNDIAQRHGKSVATVQQKLMPMLERVQKYMRRMRDGRP